MKFAFRSQVVDLETDTVIAEREIPLELLLKASDSTDETSDGA